MIGPLEFLQDLLNPELSFLLRALAAVTIAAVVCGVIGCHVVLRGMVFIGDAVAHSVFPGLAVAFVIGGNMLIGGLVAGVLTAVLVAVFSHGRKLREDSVIGVFFAGSFAAGIVIISRAPGYSGSVESFLFGSIVGVTGLDVWTSAAVGAGLLLILWLFTPQIVAVSLDRETARAMGLPVLALDILLSVVVTVAVVISLQTIGNILVLALIVIPAATARLCCRGLGGMMLFASVQGALGALLGLYAAWSLDLPVGGSIVLTLLGMFLLAWLVTSLPARRMGRRTGRGVRGRAASGAVGSDAAAAAGPGPEPEPAPGAVSAPRA